MRATGQTSKKHTAAFSDISAAAGERGLKKAYLRRVEGRLSRGVHLADINYTHTALGQSSLSAGRLSLAQ